MRIEEGKDALPSKMGALCSILLVIVLLLYAGYKTSILEGKKEIDIIQAVKENHFDDTHVFSHQQGLNFAVGVFNRHSPTTLQPIDPTYGRIRF